MATKSESTFAELLKRHRAAVGLTQEELAARSGLSRNGISALERGERLRPQRATVELLGTALELTGEVLETFAAAARSGVGTEASQSLAPPLAPSNVPLPLTSLIGRQAELATARLSLQRADVRWLTLTGPGGVGKSRLALEVADGLRRDFPDGTFLVGLASLRDPGLVIPTVARAFDVREAGERTAMAALVDALRPRRTLLALDNLEHLAAAGPLLAELLAACAGLKLLVTSRAPVHIRGEQVLPIPPLAVPSSADTGSLALLQRSPAVALFVERAQAADLAFQLTPANGATIAEICRRLDGLPLAIELAAARIPLLPPEALRRRLRETPAFMLLHDGARDLPERQQSLHRTLTWSYDLLDADEQRTFRRLSILRGGATLAAAAALADAPAATVQGPASDRAADGQAATHDSPPVLDLVASLVDKNLLRRVEPVTNEPRFGMLETIREFGLKLLVNSGELVDVRRRAIDSFVDFVERAEPELSGPEQRAWLDRLEAEHDNLRAALAWTLEAGEVERGLRLAAALALFWHIRGYSREGRDWLERAAEQARGHDQLAALRAKALSDAANLATHLGDFAAATAFGDEALAIARALGNQREIARVLGRLAAVAGQRADWERYVALHEEALGLHRTLENQRGIAGTLANLGQAAIMREEMDRASVLLTEAVDRFRAIGEHRGVAVALGTLGRVALRFGDLDRAATLFEEAIALDRQLGYHRGLAIELDRLAIVARARGELSRSRGLLTESLELWRNLADPTDLALWLEGFAAQEAASGHPEAAARFLGAATSGWREAGTDPETLAASPLSSDETTRTIHAIAAVLGDTGFATALNTGRSLTLADALSAAEVALLDAGVAGGDAPTAGGKRGVA